MRRRPRRPFQHRNLFRSFWLRLAGLRRSFFRSGWLGGVRTGSTPRVAFRAAFIALRAVVRDVKTGSFEDQPCTGADLPFHISFAPRLFTAGILRTRFQRLVFHRLKELERLVAFLAEVIVVGHRGSRTPGMLAYARSRATMEELAAKASARRE